MTEVPKESQQVLTSRRHAVMVECPECGAAPGEPCVRPAYQVPSHAERHDSAIALGAPPFAYKRRSVKKVAA